MTSKGQVTLSSKTRKKLGLEKGATFLEVLVGNCVLLVPEDKVLADIMARAQEAIKDAGVTSDDLVQEVERLKAERSPRSIRIWLNDNTAFSLSYIWLFSGSWSSS